jgi:hypothetical protein
VVHIFDMTKDGENRILSTRHRISRGKSSVDGKKANIGGCHFHYKGGRAPEFSPCGEILIFEKQLLQESRLDTLNI